MAWASPRYDVWVPNVPPPFPRRRGSDPVPVGDLLGLALPHRVQGRLFDLDFLSALWNRAAPEEIVAEAVPVRFENRVLTIAARDPEIHAETHRRRKEIARRLREAAGLPDARLRVRVELREPGAGS